MNKRKEHVVEKAHELFIEKGYHATSIQEILNSSGISKGSFYNYFDSKGELFKAVFHSIEKELKEEQDALLIGEDPSNIDIFIKQVNLTMELNRKNKLIQLVEDALVSNDPELILFIKQSKFLFLKWVYERFLHIFSEDKKPYIFDCAVLFTGLMQNILQTSSAMKEAIPTHHITNYCIDRIVTILEDISEKEVQLFTQDKVQKLFPNSDYIDFFNNDFCFATLHLKKNIEKVVPANDPKLSSYLNLVYFIQEEIMNHTEPRVFLIESALLSLQTCSLINDSKEFKEFKKILWTKI
ncbi:MULTISPECIES: TetR/AcrR family transcriptional regulator [Bacillus]|uniref:TetR/AcrR family transcriptional regulator n=1 Tax=Bacillus TaxID=1386 RepID=UPI00030EFC35|nr:MULTISPECIES: TetR/AcrR family transcriptional regulator [Bacillus]